MPESDARPVSDLAPTAASELSMRAIRPAHSGLQRVLAAALIAASAFTLAASDPASDSSTSLYAALLAQYTSETSDVVGTRVDYRRLQRDPRWKQLIRELAVRKPPASREGQLAYWINAYNILAIDTVLEHYPVDSIRDVGSFWNPVWDRDAGVAGDRTVSLGEIEHEILRPIGQPLIHAAIVCASTSCPSLAREPFREATLDEQLAAAMRRWLSNPEKGLQIDRAEKRVTLSKVFDWFEEDFEAGGGVLASIAPFAPRGDRRWLAENAESAAVDYFDYDWSLNDASR